MLFAQTQFLKSCSAVSQIPATPQPRVAFWGRSNVGKSSLLNALIGKKKARVSKTPGRTQLINLFECPKPHSLWCDLPGYGYAKMDGQQADLISKLLYDFFQKDKSPDILCWLIDSRHNLTKTDFLVLPLIATLESSLIILTTKNDKLGYEQRLKQKELLLKQLEPLRLNPIVIQTASESRLGLPELEETLLSLLQTY